MFAFVETAEGVGEAEILDEWIKTNKLQSAKSKILAYDITLEELSEFSVDEAKKFAEKTLELNTIEVKRFVKAIKKISSDSSPSQPNVAAKVIRIVLSKEEDDVMNEMSNIRNQVIKRLETLKNNINSLQNMSKENEVIVNHFRKEIIQKINQRMDELISKSNKEIQQKQAKIDKQIQQTKLYNNEIVKVQNENERLLNDVNYDKNKRKNKILSNAKNILKNKGTISDKYQNQNNKVQIDINKKDIFKFIQNIGNVINCELPAMPIISVKDVTETTAVVKLSINLKESVQCLLEVNSHSDDDEKMVDVNWKGVATLSNQNNYKLSSLNGNKLYKVRGRNKNEFGFSAYSKIVTFKTKEIQKLSDSSILTTSEQKTLLEMINKENKDIGFNLRLLYRATRDGFHKDNFHHKCDQKGRNLTVIQTTTGNVFGGFTSIPWTSENKGHGDPTAFLYLIRSSANYQPQIFKNKGTAYAVYHLNEGYDYMMVYGANGDILVYSECNVNNNTHSYVNVSPACYDVPSNYYLNGGQHKFKVVDVETFSC